MFRKSWCALFAAAALPALAAPPDAPELTYDGAPKQILLDWNYVPRANWYEIWFQANAGAAWVKLGERPSWYPHRDVNVSSHLMHWFDQRWDVRACNPSGCSAPRSIDIGSTVVSTVGYVKPARPQANAAFGAAVDVSEDGRTLAVVASGERTSAEASPGSATVHVYRGTPNNWREEAQLRPSRAQLGNGAGATVSLSADGNRLALGVPAESFGINGAPSAAHGAVYLFQRDSTGWHEQQRFTQTDPSHEHSGAFAKLSDDGETLAFSFRVLLSNEMYDQLQVYRHTSTGWQRDNWVSPEAPYDQVDFGMSGDGQLFFIRTRVGRSVEIRAYEPVYHYMVNYVIETVPDGFELSSFDVDSTGNTLASGVRPRPVAETAYDPALWKPRVTVYRLDGDPNYQKREVLVPSPYQPKTYAKRTLFGDRIAVSGNGTYVAVYDPHDAYSSSYVQLPPTRSYNSNPRGSIYVFEHHGTGYRERRHLGANDGSPDWIDGQGIFGPMAFGNDGKTFAAAQLSDDGGIGGIHRASDAESRDRSAPEAGAVWLY